MLILMLMLMLMLKHVDGELGGEDSAAPEDAAEEYDDANVVGRR